MELGELHKKFAKSLQECLFWGDKKRLQMSQSENIMRITIKLLYNIY